jgi:hypothetical protein
MNRRAAQGADDRERFGMRVDSEYVIYEKRLPV